VGYLEAVEARIRDAVAGGQFSGLPGEGKPQALRPEDSLAGDQWLGFKLLQNGGLVPEWLSLGRDIERAQERLDGIDRRHAELVAGARRSDAWDGTFAAIRGLRDHYEREARELRRLQEKFNWDAPGRLSQRPPIWVEYHVERLDARVSSPLPAAQVPFPLY
jgi:hypothetical protein